MSKTQFLLFLTAVIPLASCAFAVAGKKHEKLVNVLSKIAPIAFVMNLSGFTNVSHINISFTILDYFPLLSLGFGIDKMALLSLCLLGFIWLIFAFYSHAFLKLSDEADKLDFTLFSLGIFTIVTFILIAKTLLTIVICYSILLYVSHLFAVRLLYQEAEKISQSFTYLLAFKAVIFFFAAIFTFYFGSKTSFSAGQVILQNISDSQQILVLTMYLGGLFSLILIPSYLLYQKINFNSLKIYAVFFAGLAFSSLYLFIKMLVFVFGLASFSGISLTTSFSCFEWIFLINLMISSYFLLVAPDLKSSFLYLFFHQCGFALFAIFILAAFNGNRIYVPLASFTLGITLAFLCLSNLIIYLANSQNSGSKGLFYDLKTTSLLLGFAILNLAGIMPGLGMFEKFLIMKEIFTEGLILSVMIFFLNFITLVAFGVKLFHLLFATADSKKSKDLELAKMIDSDSSLMLTALITALIIFVIPIISNSIFSL